MSLSLKIAVIGILSATGLGLRTVAFPITVNVQITPGMIAPILSGILLGVWPGVITGIIIGVYAAVFSGELWLIPFIGNILLALGAGIAADLTKKKSESYFKMSMLIITPSIIGGFIPTFTILCLIMPGAFIIALISGIFDMINALIASIIAVLTWSVLKKIKFTEQLTLPAAT